MMSSPPGKVVIDLTGDEHIPVIDLTGDESPVREHHVSLPIREQLEQDGRQTLRQKSALAQQRPLPPLSLPPLDYLEALISAQATPPPAALRTARTAWSSPASSSEIEDRAIVEDPSPDLLLPLRRIAPRRPRQLHVSGSRESPILIVDNDEEVSVRQIPAEARPDTAQGELILFSDGSVVGQQQGRNGGYGGCGIAYKTRGHWSGRAIAIGPVKGSVQAELEGVYRAFQLAAELLEPEHRRVSIYTDCIVIVNNIAGAKEVGDADGTMGSIIADKKKFLSKGVEVKVAWVKGHDVSAGNEMADLLAGMGSQQAWKGFSGGSWDDPDLGMMEISGNQMRNLSERAEVRTNGRRERAEFRAPERSERKLETRRKRKKLEPRREMKLELRRSRRLMEQQK